MPKEKRQPDRRPGQVYVGVHIPAATLGELDERAEQDGRTRAGMIRRIIEQYLAANPLEAAAAR